jgi:hypothetical protein
LVCNSLRFVAFRTFCLDTKGAQKIKKKNALPHMAGAGPLFFFLARGSDDVVKGLFYPIQ